MGVGFIDCPLQFVLQSVAGPAMHVDTLSK
ncbi:hypothetical protein ACVITL_005786 [Rhizobium pisi]